MHGMGTTVVATVANEHRAIVCNVGDSRAYLLSGDTLKQITRDHSMVQSLVESGKLSPEEAVAHPKKNIITRALGVEENLIIDNFCVDIDEGNKLLLCSDGLSNCVAPDKILSVVNTNALDKAVDILIQEANFAGGKDNITAVIVSQ